MPGTDKKFDTYPFRFVFLEAVEYELDQKASVLSANIQQGVTTGYKSVKTFVEVKSICLRYPEGPP